MDRLRRPCDDSHHFFDLERLLEVVEGTEADGFDGVSLGAVRSDDDHLRARCRSLAKLRKQLDAAHARHLNVRDHQLVVATGDLLEALSAIDGLVDL